MFEFIHSFVYYLIQPNHSLEQTKYNKKNCCCLIVHQMGFFCFTQCFLLYSGAKVHTHVPFTYPVRSPSGPSRILISALAFVFSKAFSSALTFTLPFQKQCYSSMYSIPNALPNRLQIQFLKLESVKLLIRSITVFFSSLGQPIQFLYSTGFFARSSPINGIVVLDVKLCVYVSQRIDFDY